MNILSTHTTLPSSLLAMRETHLAQAIWNFCFGVSCHMAVSAENRGRYSYNAGHITSSELWGCSYSAITVYLTEPILSCSKVLVQRRVAFSPPSSNWFTYLHTCQARRGTIILSNDFAFSSCLPSAPGSRRGNGLRMVNLLSMQAHLQE